MIIGGILQSGGTGACVITFLSTPNLYNCKWCATYEVIYMLIHPATQAKAQWLMGTPRTDYTGLNHKKQLDGINFPMRFEYH